MVMTGQATMQSAAIAHSGPRGVAGWSMVTSSRGGRGNALPMPPRGAIFLARSQDVRDDRWSAVTRAPHHRMVKSARAAMMALHLSGVVFGGPFVDPASAAAAGAGPARAESRVWV